VRLFAKRFLTMRSILLRALNFQDCRPPIALSTYLKLLAVALFWGGTWVAGRVAVGEASPLAVASWRFLFAALALGGLLVVRDGWPRWRRREWALAFALGASGIFLYNVCFLYGLKFIEAGRGALVVALTPAAIALADWLFHGAGMSGRKALGIAVAMAGCLLVVTRGEPSALLSGAIAGGIGAGEWLILGCVVLWTAYTFASRRATRTMSPLAATFGASLTGWAMLTLAALVDGSLFSLAQMSWRGASSIVFLGLFGTAVAFTWYAAGVHSLGATQAGAFINLVPVFAVLLGALLLGERLPGTVLAGGALVMTGVIITNRAPLVPRQPRQRFGEQQA
jgi:drug/metabolite transporter (DMT)-like permease